MAAIATADERLKHSIIYDASTSEIKDDIVQLVACLVRCSKTYGVLIAGLVSISFLTILSLMVTSHLQKTGQGALSRVRQKYRVHHSFTQL